MSSPFKFWGNPEAVTVKEKKKIVQTQRAVKRNKNNRWISKED